MLGHLIVACSCCIYVLQYSNILRNYQECLIHTADLPTVHTASILNHERLSSPALVRLLFSRPCMYGDSSWKYPKLLGWVNYHRRIDLTEVPWERCLPLPSHLCRYTSPVFSFARLATKMHIKAILAFAAGIAGIAGIAGAAGHHNHVAQSHHRRATSVSAFTSPHGPTMTGTVNTCNKWYKVVSGDTCYSITQKFGISLEDFLRWNPAVSDDCLTNFRAEVFYCVGVKSISSSGVGRGSTATPPVTTASTAENTSTIAATSSNTTTTTPYSTLTYNTTTNPVTITNSAWPPTLTQPGQPDYCMCHRQD